MTIDLSPIVAAWPFLAKALGTTLLVSIASMLLGLVLGLFVGAGRVYGGRALDLILGFYVDTMRAIPVLVVLVWTFFAFPLLIGRSLNAITAGVAGARPAPGGYVAEVIRAGLTSVRPGQMRAALALGMSRRGGGPHDHPAASADPHAAGARIAFRDRDQGQRHRLGHRRAGADAPVADRRRQDLRPFEIYTCAMLVYFLLCYPIARGIDRLYRRVAHLGSS